MATPSNSLVRRGREAGIPGAPLGSPSPVGWLPAGGDGGAARRIPWEARWEARYGGGMRALVGAEPPAGRMLAPGLRRREDG